MSEHRYSQYNTLINLTLLIGLSSIINIITYIIFSNLDTPLISDEVAYIEIAKYFSFSHLPNLYSDPPYRFGQPLALSWIFSLTEDVSVFYKVSIFITVLESSIIPIILFLIAKWAGARTGVYTVICCIIVSTIPAHFYANSAMWPENSIRLMFVSIVLSYIVSWRRNNLIAIMAIAILSGMLPAFHSRFVFIPFISIVFLVFLGISGRYRKARLAICILTIIALFYLVDIGNKTVLSALWPEWSGDVGTIRTFISRLESLDGLHRVAAVSFGQIWSQIVSSFGLWAIGIIYIFYHIYTKKENWVAYLFIVLMMATVFAASVMQMTVLGRVDHLVFSRYNDAVSPLINLLGILYVAQLIPRGISIKSEWLSAATGLLGTAAFLLALEFSMKRFVLPGAPALLWTGWLAKIDESPLPVIFLGTVAGSLAFAVILSNLGKRTIISLLLVCVVASDFVIYSEIQSLADDRSQENVRRGNVYDIVDGEDIYWDKSVSRLFNLTFDQLVVVGKPMPSSDIVNNDIPYGTAAVVSPDFGKDGYRCIGVLSPQVKLIERRSGAGPCGQLHTRPIQLSGSRPYEFSAQGTFYFGGWSFPERWGRWTDGYHATLRFEVPVSDRPRVLQFDAQGYLPKSYVEQRIGVRLNGMSQSDWVFTRVTRRSVQHLVVPPGVPVLDVEFSIPHAISPKKAGESIDTRTVGLGLRSVCLAQALEGNCLEAAADKP